MEVLIITAGMLLLGLGFVSGLFSQVFKTLVK